MGDFVETMRIAEKAQEDIYFAKINRELIAELHRLAEAEQAVEAGAQQGESRALELLLDRYGDDTVMQAIAELGRRLGVRPQAAMVLCEWDRDNLLRRVPTATWKERNGVRSKAPSIPSAMAGVRPARMMPTAYVTEIHVLRLRRSRGVWPISGSRAKYGVTYTVSVT